MLKQSFEIFNTYGRPAEALDSILQGFMLVLGDQDQADITAAFQKWMHTSAAMPTPADILKLTEEIRIKRVKARGLKTFADFDGDFNTYKQYLAGEGF